MTVFIHPMACTDETVSIGEGSRVWQFATVIKGTILGQGCNVGAGAVLEGARFGVRCKIGPNVHVGPGFEIGDDVFIGSNVVLCNDCWPRVDREGFDADLLRNGFVSVRIGNGASIGVNAVILPGVTIGAGAMIAAGAVVNRDVPANCLWTLDGVEMPINERPKRRMREALC